MGAVKRNRARCGIRDVGVAWRYQRPGAAGTGTCGVRDVCYVVRDSWRWVGDVHGQSQFVGPSLGKLDYIRGIETPSSPVYRFSQSIPMWYSISTSALGERALHESHPWRSWATGIIVNTRPATFLGRLAELPASTLHQFRFTIFPLARHSDVISSIMRATC